MYAILNTIRVLPEHLDEFLANARQHAGNSLTEPGCMRFDVLQDRQDPCTVCLYEVFRSEADLDAHRTHDYYKRWMTMSRAWRDVAAGTRRVLSNVHPPDEAWVKS